jgi:predicted ThiF/HesA family dinucleotide-utilizing enzyme
MKKALIGTYFKNAKEAFAEVAKKDNLRLKRTFAVISFAGGFLVVDDEQLLQFTKNQC